MFLLQTPFLFMNSPYSNFVAVELGRIYITINKATSYSSEKAKMPFSVAAQMIE
jgi:hypothetical protein